MMVQFSSLLGLIGNWQGIGQAEYPTIQPTSYREELTFSHNHKDFVFHYVQKAWKIAPTGEDLGPLFWESGFLIDKGEGIFELVSAQKSGRVEVLRGTAIPTNQNGIELELMSISIVNDERMLSSRRRFHILTDDIHYELDMSTQNNPLLQRHLSAKLKRFLL